MPLGIQNTRSWIMFPRCKLFAFFSSFFLLSLMDRVDEKSVHNTVHGMVVISSGVVTANDIRMRLLLGSAADVLSMLNILDRHSSIF